MTPNTTIPAERQLTAEEWQAKREERRLRDTLYDRLALHLRKLDLRTEFEDALDHAQAGDLVKLPSVEDADKAYAPGLIDFNAWKLNA